MKATLNQDGGVTLNLTRDEFYDLDRIITNLTPDGCGYMYEDECSDVNFNKVTAIFLKEHIYKFRDFFTTLFSDKQNRLF